MAARSLHHAQSGLRQRRPLPEDIRSLPGTGSRCDPLLAMLDIENVLGPY